MQLIEHISDRKKNVVFFAPFLPPSGQNMDVLVGALAAILDHEMAVRIETTHHEVITHEESESFRALWLKAAMQTPGFLPLHLFLCLVLFVALGTEPQALQYTASNSTPELHPQTLAIYF